MATQGLQVRLIGKANGVGLSRDIDLLAAALRACGCEVSVRGCERRDRKRRRGVLTRLLARARAWRRAVGGGNAGTVYDINLMLEHVWPQFLHEAACNVLVPNPEWFDRRDVAFLGAAQRVWAKTSLAQRLFTARGCRALTIGFDSVDRYRAGIAREPRFLHVAGRSPLKGTARLLALWRRHPEWPLLTVVQDAQLASDGAGSAGNIAYRSGFLDDEALCELQNAHWFHLCPSEAEGWGHYIAEAMSVGAVTFTCDAPPMNELVSAARGVLVPAPAGERHNLATLCHFDPAALEGAIARVLGMAPAQWQEIGVAARAWFLQNKQDFTSRVRGALNELGELRERAATSAAAAQGERGGDGA